MRCHYYHFMYYNTEGRQLDDNSRTPGSFGSKRPQSGEMNEALGRKCWQAIWFFASCFHFFYALSIQQHSNENLQTYTDMTTTIDFFSKPYDIQFRLSRNNNYFSFWQHEMNLWFCFQWKRSYLDTHAMPVHVTLAAEGCHCWKEIRSVTYLLQSYQQLKRTIERPPEYSYFTLTLGENSEVYALFIGGK